MVRPDNMTGVGKALIACFAVVKKALRPDIFQDFTLKEKNSLSHNVAMYVNFRIRP